MSFSSCLVSKCLIFSPPSLFISLSFSLSLTSLSLSLARSFYFSQGITFDEFRSFFQFLNNLEDFTIAMQMYNFASRSIGQGLSPPYHQPLFVIAAHYMLSQHTSFKTETVKHMLRSGVTDLLQLLLSVCSSPALHR